MARRSDPYKTRLYGKAYSREKPYYIDINYFALDHDARLITLRVNHGQHNPTTLTLTQKCLTGLLAIPAEKIIQDIERGTLIINCGEDLNLYFDKVAYYCRNYFKTDPVQEGQTVLDLLYIHDPPPVRMSANKAYLIKLAVTLTNPKFDNLGKGVGGKKAPEGVQQLRELLTSSQWESDEDFCDYASTRSKAIICEKLNTKSKRRVAETTELYEKFRGDYQEATKGSESPAPDRSGPSPRPKS